MPQPPGAGLSLPLYAVRGPLLPPPGRDGTGRGGSPAKRRLAVIPRSPEQAGPRPLTAAAPAAAERPPGAAALLSPLLPLRSPLLAHPRRGRPAPAPPLGAARSARPQPSPLRHRPARREALCNAAVRSGRQGRAPG